MHEVFPDIHMITQKGALGVVRPPVNIYILAGSDGLVFDAGYGTKASLAFLGNKIDELKSRYDRQGKKFKITRAIPSHSHPDHFSGLTYLRKEYGVRVLLTQHMARRLYSEKTFYYRFVDWKNRLSRHPKLLEYFGLRYFQPRLHGTTFVGKPDKIIPENTTLMINDELWWIFPSPGHCDDHISLYHPRKGVLFSGDNIMRSITTWLGPPRSSLRKYCDSLKKILELPRLELVLSAHGSPVENPKERIKELLDHREERTDEVYNAIKKKGDSGIPAKQIIRNIYSLKEYKKRYLSAGWVSLTLADLVERERIRKVKKRDGVWFYPL